MKIANNITELIGSTPLVRLNKLNQAPNTEVILKLEFFNPLASVKDRIALSMIEDAEKKGLLDHETVIIEPTSGNTGIGLAYIAAQRGYQVILTMPDTMSRERQNLLKALGAQLILTKGADGMTGSIKQAEQLAAQYEKFWIPQQFNNPANPEIHRKTTALEIWQDTEGLVDLFVAGVGTGGTITGVGEVLKKKKPGVKIIAVEPENSAVMTGKPPGSHKIQGIGAGFIPKILNKHVIDQIILVKDEDARQTALRLAREEGILCGISGGANVFAALEIARQPVNQGKKIVTIIPDTGERYLSSWLFAE